jgi:hypothetical protein
MNVLLCTLWDTKPEAHQEDVPTSGTDTQNVFLCRATVGTGSAQMVTGRPGRAAPIRPPAVAAQFVVGLLSASHTYAVTGTWTGSGPARASRLISISADGRISVVTLSGLIGAVVADAPHAWGVTFPGSRHPNGSLVPVAGGGRRVRLRAGFLPVAITEGVIVGNVGSAAAGAGSLLLVDAATSRIRANAADGLTVAVGHGVVVWTAGCEPDTNRPCTMHRRSVNDGGATASYRVPRAPGIATGVLSADGRLPAFTLERPALDPRYERQDPRYEQGHPIPPADIAILHLDTGALYVAPGIETPAKMTPALARSGPTAAGL